MSSASNVSEKKSFNKYKGLLIYFAEMMYLSVNVCIPAYDDSKTLYQR